MISNILEQTIQQYYATDRSLRIQEATRARYLVPQVDFASWTLNMLDWRGDEFVLDIGAGTGSHYERLMRDKPRLRYYALDLSPYMLRCHPGEARRLACADALRLPHPDAT
ncbi:MAG: class I SAM-dependent methyltransferase, partial [Chloroflexi bacterium]|nr:class I SAM-dependent methyltransferase [Chloroflexota bacterium]